MGSTATSLLHSEPVSKPESPESEISTQRWTNDQSKSSADTELLSKRSSPDESNSSNQSSTSFTLIRPSMPTTKPPWPTTVLNLPLKSMLSSALSKDKLMSLSPNSRKNTDATTSASSPLDVTDSTEEDYQDHHAFSHNHQNTHTRWSVSMITRTTGSVPNTH